MRNLRMFCVIVYAAACALIAILVFAVVVDGCANVPNKATRTIYIPDGEPVRLRQTVPDVDVWVMDSKGEWIAGNVDLPEGWYALPDPGEHTTETVME